MMNRFNRLKPGVCLAVILMVWNPVAHAKPDEVNESQVNGCRFLNRIQANSGYGKNTGWINIAKTKALQKAQASGASHIVWKNFNPTGSFNGEARADAYLCQP